MNIGFLKLSLIVILSVGILSGCGGSSSDSDDDSDELATVETNQTNESNSEGVDDTEPALPVIEPEPVAIIDPPPPVEVPVPQAPEPEVTVDPTPAIPSEPESGIADDWFRPAVMATWQWQISETVNTSYDVEIYDIDLFDSPDSLIQQLQASGKKVICYFSAGSYEEWRDDAADFSDGDLGNELDGWEGERWLDIRSANVRSIMQRRLDKAVEKSCDGVEPDNVDGYTNSPGVNFTAADQLDYNRFLAEEAHKRGLAIGLKNDLDQVAALVDHFDFGVNEQCFQYSECDLLLPFVNQGKPVFNAEYANKYVSNSSALCTQSIGLQFSTLVLPIDLDDSFRMSCL